MRWPRKWTPQQPHINCIITKALWWQICTGKYHSYSENIKIKLFLQFCLVQLVERKYRGFNKLNYMTGNHENFGLKNPKHIKLKGLVTLRLHHRFCLSAFGLFCCFSRFPEGFPNEKSRSDLCNNQICKHSSFFLLVTANGKLMAISVGVCVPAFCLLIFIKDPLLPLSVWSEEGWKRGCVSPNTLNMIYHSGWWCSGVMRSLPFSLGLPL